MNEFSFSVPQNITVGKGSLTKLPEIAKKSGRWGLWRRRQIL